MDCKPCQKHEQLIRVYRRLKAASEKFEDISKNWDKYIAETKNTSFLIEEKKQRTNELTAARREFWMFMTELNKAAP